MAGRPYHMHLIYDPAQVLGQVLGALVYGIQWCVILALPVAVLAVLAVRRRWGPRLTARMAPGLIWRRK